MTKQRPLAEQTNKNKNKLNMEMTSKTISKNEQKRFGIVTFNIRLPLHS